MDKRLAGTGVMSRHCFGHKGKWILQLWDSGRLGNQMVDMVNYRAIEIEHNVGIVGWHFLVHGLWGITPRFQILGNSGVMGLKILGYRLRWTRNHKQARRIASIVKWSLDLVHRVLGVRIVASEEDGEYFGLKSEWLVPKEQVLTYGLSGMNRFVFMWCSGLRDWRSVEIHLAEVRKRVLKDLGLDKVIRDRWQLFVHIRQGDFVKGYPLLNAEEDEWLTRISQIVTEEGIKKVVVSSDGELNSEKWLSHLTSLGKGENQIVSSFYVGRAGQETTARSIVSEMVKSRVVLGNGSTLSMISSLLAGSKYVHVKDSRIVEWRRWVYTYPYNVNWR